MEMWLDLRRIVYVLSDALDLVGIDDVGHGKRVAFMAARAGEVMGFSGTAIEDLLAAGMFHDCGVSSTGEHRSLAGGLDWDGQEAHCVRGQALAVRFRPLAHLAPVIRWHHTHAQVLETMDLPVLVKVFANLIYLADRVDVMMALSGTDPLLARDGIFLTVKDNVGTRFRPDVVQAFLEAGSHEEFWLTLEPRTLSHWLNHQSAMPAPRYMSMSDLEALGGVFASIVDAKSPFTSEHSHAVAGVARLLSSLAGLSPDRSRKVGVAALLHDIGKLRVPDPVLDKPGPLDAPERATMIRHAFDTFNILNRIEGFQDIAQWAAFHHECVRGGGYPFGHSGDKLSVEARIIAVSDVFQALRQDRPYRASMSIEGALGLIDEMSLAGKLDPDVVGLLHSNIDACDHAARAQA